VGWGEGRVGWQWGGGGSGIEVGCVLFHIERILMVLSIKICYIWMAPSDRVIDYCIGMTTVQVEHKIIYIQYSLLYLKDIKNL